MSMDIPNTVDRAHIVVAASDRDAANQFAAQVDPDSGGPYTFNIPLIPSDGPDDAEPTHYGCSTRLTGSGAAQVEQLKPQLGSVQLYWLSGGWTWGRALEDAGLKKQKSGAE